MITHSKRQIKQVAASMRSVGFAKPVLIDEDGVLLAGHARREAAKLLGLTSVPAIVIDGLSDALLQEREHSLLLVPVRWSPPNQLPRVVQHPLSVAALQAYPAVAQ